MAVRSVPWQRTVSDAVSWRQDQAQTATIYILRETGPTGFLLKEEGESKKFKVFLGDPHKCTCSVFMKERDLCKHICWVLLKKFRLDRTNDLSFQKGLVEREINEVLRGLARREDPRRRAAATRIAKNAAAKGESYRHTDGKEAMAQRDITEEDVCPICQDELLGSREPVTYCRFGCGKSTHIKCMKVWADHQKSTGETVLKCPLCREDFGQIDTVEAEYRNATLQKTRAERADIHMGTACSGCNQAPIAGKCYKCTSCSDFYFCQNCFASDSHTHHSFQFRQKSNQRWRPAQRGSGGALPTAVITDLQNRDISDEDYDTLLQLDNAASNQASAVPERVVKSFHTETVREGSALLSLGTQCRVCLRSYSMGQLVKKLPCRHKFHAECIDQWLLHSHPTCPVDGTVVWSPFMEEANRQAKKKKKSTPANSEEGQTSAPLEIIPGIGVIKLHGRGPAGGSGRGAVVSGGGHLMARGADGGAPMGLAGDFQLTGAGLSSRTQQGPSSQQQRGIGSVNIPSSGRSDRSYVPGTSSRQRKDVHRSALQRFPSNEDLINHIAGANAPADSEGHYSPNFDHASRVHNLHIGAINEPTNQRPPFGSGRGTVAHRPPVPPTATERTSSHIASIPLPREEANMTPIGPNHHGSNSAPSHSGRKIPSQNGGGLSPGSMRDNGRIHNRGREGVGGRRARSTSLDRTRNRSGSRERLHPKPQDKFQNLENMFLGSATGHLLTPSGRSSSDKAYPSGTSSHHPRSKVKPALRKAGAVAVGELRGMGGTDLALAGSGLNSLHLSGIGDDDFR